MKPTIFVLMNSLDVKRGGLTRASLKQADTFIKLGYKTHLVTFNFNKRYPSILNELKKNGSLNKNIVVHNLYNHLSHFDSHHSKYCTPNTLDIQKFLKQYSYEKRDGFNAYRIFDNGLYSKYIAIDDKTENIDFIDYFNENRYRTKRVTFDLQGDVCRTTFMDLKSNTPRQTVYYNKKGQAYLTRWFQPQEETPVRTIIFSEDGLIKKTYTKNHQNIKVDWLSNLIDSYTDNQAIVISDTRSTDDVLINLKNKKSKKVWRLHSGHLRSPYTLESNLSPNVQSGINNIKKFDAVVLLTNEQKKDIINRCGDPDNLQVIPHFHNKPSRNISKLLSEKNKDRAVVVSRLSSLKRIDDIIKAFKIVNKELPNVYLDIYGIGDHFNHIDSMIKEFNLENRIKLHGYVSNPDKVFEDGLFSILTSKQEGFALSVLESMTNKTPVISYQIRYGPTDMIINNKTGILVENGNINSLAKEMINLYNNPSKAITLGANAQKHVNKTFSEKYYREKWMSLLKSLTK